jgi:Zn-dependent alcohol dehydrogenase
MEFLAPSGRYILLGHSKPGESVELANANHMFQGEGKTIRATQGGGFNPTADIPRYVALWRSGRLNLDNIISHRVSLQDVNKGIDLVRNGEAGRVLVMMR